MEKSIWEQLQKKKVFSLVQGIVEVVLIVRACLIERPR